MKKYILKWINPEEDTLEVNYILADNEIEAEQIATLLIQFYNNNCGVENIHELREVTDDEIFYNMKDVKKLYEICNK